LSVQHITEPEGVDQLVTGTGGKAPGHLALVEYDVTKYVENDLVLLE